MKYPSIFNDVLSPITPGPSSSNTCGPYRIALICKMLLGQEPISLTINMAKDGGFSDTFYSMQSDLGFLTGIMGKELLSYDLNCAYEDAKKLSIKTSFNFIDGIPLNPSESCEIILSGIDRTIKVSAASLGGGEIEITKINEKAVYLDGKSIQHVTYPLLNNEKNAYETVVNPIFPFNTTGKTPPFHNAVELFEYAKANGNSISQLAFTYEEILTGSTNDQLRLYARKILEISDNACLGGLKEGLQFEGVTSQRARSYKNKLENGKLIPLGAADYGCLDALSIMEHSNSHGTIVCMPTGGSSGIIPAVIKNVGKALGCTNIEMENALMVAGLIGTYYYPTHYTGALGCQAEIGVAISMAAAAACSMLTDNPDIIHCAASLGGQSVLGMICNPVNGYVQVPCILRNIMAVPISISCANSAISGLDHIVPLDKVSEIMLDVGKKLRPCNQIGTYNI